MTIRIHRLLPFLTLGVLMITGAPTPDSHAATTPNAERVHQADSLFAAGRFAEAAPIYQELTVAAPEVGRHWARYGGCLHSLGRFDEAVSALTRAESIGHNPTVMFNLACSLARAGRPEKSLDWLTKAGESGFNNVAGVESDDDLASLKSNPRWAGAVLAVDRQARPCAHDERYGQLDFWVGEWDVKTVQGQPAGSSRVERILNDCIILENWTGFGGTSGKSFNFIEPASGQWRQTWVDDKGDAHEYQGEFVQGEMRYRRVTVGADGHKVLNKMTFFNVAEGHVRQLGEHSDDDGKSWIIDYDLHYFRRKS